MKKKIIISASILITLTFVSAYFYIQNKEQKRKLIITQPWDIILLRESLEKKGVILEDVCADTASLGKDKLNLENPENSRRFLYLCEDIQTFKDLEENYNTNIDYTYFLKCAKLHADNMQQISNDLKSYYPEDYKELNFNKDKQVSILGKYLKYPKSAELMAQCEAKTEALYWRSIVKSTKVEDLKFCQKITKECIDGVVEVSECPTDFKNYYGECTRKLNDMKHLQ